ncbi:MAG: hypothetical protein QOK43_1519 [Acidimicrobiaceae bacterium]|nr:hypothetical protein [Acidimicrobiaceae bacterium]MDQ1444637.1 hypothetical protein [Acidimicrobiaceae bacterium]
MRATAPLVDNKTIDAGNVMRIDTEAIDLTVTLSHGEELGVLERVVVAPCLGVFEPLAPKTVTTEGEIVHAGQAIGVLRSSGSDVEVRSPFSGFMMGVMAHSGERVREGQPVAWLRVFER